MLVLSPTRELATQIGDSFKAYGAHLGFRVAITGRLDASTGDGLETFQKNYGVVGPVESGPATLRLLEQAVQCSVSIYELMDIAPQLDETRA